MEQVLDYFLPDSTTAGQTIDISLGSLILIYLLLIYPFLLILKFKLNLLKQFFLALFRMTIQLVFVGFYLQFIFKINSLWINIGWIFVMIFVANLNIIHSVGLNKKTFFLPLFSGLSIGSALVIFYFVLLCIKPQPLYDARYLIPLAGMILGNCLRTNIIGLERFYTALKKNQDEYIAYLMMGANRLEAITPYLRESFTAAIIPIISSIATIGLVSLPGMMTGQILGGTSPLVAIKYQIAIMIAILASSILGSSLTLFFSLKVAFNEYYILKRDLFVKK